MHIYVHIRVFNPLCHSSATHDGSVDKRVDNSSLPSQSTFKVWDPSCSTQGNSESERWAHTPALLGVRIRMQHLVPERS